MTTENAPTAAPTTEAKYKRLTFGARRAAARRHSRLMAVAARLIHSAELRLNASVEDVSALDVTVLAFGRHQIRMGEAEAVHYLAAALVQNGHSINHLPAALLDSAIAGGAR